MRFTRRRSAGILLALAACALPVLLFWPGDASRDATRGVEHDASEAGAVPPLRTEEVPSTAECPPTLVGRHDAAVPEATASAASAATTATPANETTDAGLPLEIEWREAETGRRLTGLATAVTIPNCPREPRPLGGGAFQVFPPRGIAVSFYCDVEPPPGRLLWELAQAQTCISRYATVLRFVAPLRREHAVTVTVDEADGSPAGADLCAVQVAGRSLRTDRTVEGIGPGRFRLRGVPHMPGELLQVSAVTTAPERVGSVRAAAAIPDDPREDLDIQARLPPLRWRDDSGGFNSTIGIGGGAGGMFSGRGGRRGYLPRGSATVEVRRRDGSPAVNALVTIAGRRAYTDHLGRACVIGLPLGRHDVKVRQTGLMPISGSVEVAEGEEAHLRLDEPAAAEVEVEVVDESGLPLPFASLTAKTASGEAWVDLEGGVQRLDPFTDHEGRRTLHNVEPGVLRLAVRWGSRRREVRVAATASEIARVRVVLPRRGAKR